MSAERLTREIEAGEHRKSPEPDPLGFFCARCQEDWPCSYVEGVAAERARIAEAVRALPYNEVIHDYVLGTGWEAVDRAAVLRLVWEPDR